ncbi:MAG: hypothetical protein H8E37_11820 [Planctomycetes bacterium]|nr:hypothetical protein [Planctomycetota bacterium]
MFIQLRTLPVYCLGLLATVLIGCGDPDADVTEVQESDVHDAQGEAAASEHVHKAPHDGHLIPLGDHEYNIEMVFTAESRELHAYVLGGHAEKVVQLDLESFDFDQEDEEGNEVEITLTANPQEGDKDGMASRYTAMGEAIPEDIKDLEDLHGHVHIEIDGKQYTGDLDHDHEEGKGHDKDEDGHDKDGDNDKDHGGEKDNDAAKPAAEEEAAEEPAAVKEGPTETEAVE